MNRDLIHFLRLGLMRVRHRAAELAIELRVTGAAGATDAPGPARGPSARTRNAQNFRRPHLGASTV